jgi:hypothetical protein
MKKPGKRMKPSNARRVIARSIWNVKAGTATKDQTTRFGKAVRDLNFWKKRGKA